MQVPRGEPFAVRADRLSSPSSWRRAWRGTGPVAQPRHDRDVDSGTTCGQPPDHARAVLREAEYPQVRTGAVAASGGRAIRCGTVDGHRDYPDDRSPAGTAAPRHGTADACRTGRTRRGVSGCRSRACRRAAGRRPAPAPGRTRRRRRRRDRLPGRRPTAGGTPTRIPRPVARMPTLPGFAPRRRRRTSPGRRPARPAAYPRRSAGAGGRSDGDAPSARATLDRRRVDRPGRCAERRAAVPRRAARPGGAAPADRVRPHRWATASTGPGARPGGALRGWSAAVLEVPALRLLLDGAFGDAVSAAAAWSPACFLMLGLPVSGDRPVRAGDRRGRSPISRRRRPGCAPPLAYLPVGLILSSRRWPR